MRSNRSNQSKSLAFRPADTNNILMKLFSVTVTHNYYTLNDALCPDFTIAPTPSSAQFMSKFGMAFRAERTGFTVFIEKGRRANLLAYLLESAENAKNADSGTQYWERLTFSMRLQNPLFVTITELPVATKTTQTNLYGCNSQSHKDDATVVLNAGQFMGTEALYPVVSNALALDFPPNAVWVTVTDIAGAAVILMRIIDSSKHVALDLSKLPYDLYTISATDKDDQPVEDGTYPWTVLYVAQQPDSMVLLDMLFMQPTPQATGVYPISLTHDGIQEPIFTYVSYRLAFDARRTCWRYFVVSQDPAGTLNQLQIKGTEAVFTEEPEPTILPDGTTAIVFSSQSALPLRQKSPLHFQLTGQRRDANGYENPIKITRLPVAASAPVWPGPDQQSSPGISEIFVYV
ncbi:hypothetical protein ACVBEF_12345 [Glaciimonas sp. GG7]